MRVEYTLLMLEGMGVTEVYLSELMKAGYPPTNIVLLKKKPKKLGKKLGAVSKVIGEQATRSVFNMYSNLRYGNTISKSRGKLDPIIRTILSNESFRITDLENTPKYLKSLKVYEVASTDINSKEVIQFLEKNIEGAILTAGLGILKQEVLSLKKVKFINIHSGLVPEQRGADNFYYALLNGEKTGCSVFYIDRGIDTGNIIYMKETPLHLKNKGLSKFKTDDIIRSIKFIVPYFKIKVFIDYLKQQNETESLDLMNLPTRTQNTLVGRNYYFVHKEFAKQAINKII